MSFMSKFLVTGNDAGTFLNYLSTANVDDKCGTITYTQWLNEGGRMEADLTVAKLKEDKFLVIASDTMHNQVLSHMRHLAMITGCNRNLCTTQFARTKVSQTVATTDVSGYRYASV
jgi:glycine cleavage system aminomethyltransferase T